MRHAHLAPLLLVAALLLGCTRETSVPKATATASASAEATASSTATPTPTPSATPTPVIVEVATGNVVPNLPAGVTIVEDEPLRPSLPQRPQANQADYPSGAMAIQLSRDARFAVYARGGLGNTELILRNVQTRTETSLGPIPYCFCDAGFNVGPQWSPSDRYFAFIEGRAADLMARTPPAPARLRIVIVEVASGLTRPLEAGSQLPSLIYQRGSNWHPKQDVLTYQTGDEARVYDVTSNQSRSLGTGSNPLFWSEDLLAYRASASATSGLAVLDFGTNTTVGRSPWLSDTQFRYTGGQLTLAGVSAGSCDGVTMLHPGGATRCLPGANQPKWSPDGSRLAITQSDGSNLRAVAVVDGASGQSRILIRGLAIPDQQCWDYRIHWSTNNAFLRLTPNVVYCGGI